MMPIIMCSDKTEWVEVSDKETNQQVKMVEEK